MDKNTAYQVISQFKENNCKNEVLANALDEALKALKPVATNNVYVVTLDILEKSSLCPSRYVSTDLWLEVTNDKKKMQAHIAEWRSKIVERCKDVIALSSLIFIMGVLIILRQTKRIAMSCLFTLKVNTIVLDYLRPIKVLKVHMSSVSSTIWMPFKK